MPRNPALGPPAPARNRIRVTNKTRLRIIQGNIDGDNVDQDSFIAGNLATAGVDAEDANEHHLQAVLSAAASARQNELSSQAATASATVPAAYIPTPDSTGVVDNWEEFYPRNAWVDPASYVRSSETVDEAVEAGLNNNFTYYLDERDREWLDKNNEEARGEGTSAQGSLSPGATRSSNRSARAKGKDSEVVQPIAMSDDEFELVMGVFEKVTHEKTEFLHHGIEQGMKFPPFTDYQESFANPLPPSMFTTFKVPKWVAAPAQMLKLAKVVYPYWRERRLERKGHRIIPSLNFDEADTLNEAYICFRRREIKAVRKTRASQVASSDKLYRLAGELDAAVKMAQLVISREEVKKKKLHEEQAIWDKRQTFVDMKRKFPSLGGPSDEDILYDKEKAPKKPKQDGSASARIPNLKLRPSHIGGDISSPVIPPEARERPQERYAKIKALEEKELQRRKERDHGYEDSVDAPYQAPFVPLAQKHFEWAAPSGSPAWPSSSSSAEGEQPPSCALRIRIGRLGRKWLDRRLAGQRALSSEELMEAAIDKRRRLMQGQQDDEPEEEARERASRLADRWKYDSDDLPPSGPEGPDEQDRELVDDFDVRYMRHRMSLLSDPDVASCITDGRILVTSAEGRPHQVLPIQPSPIKAHHRMVSMSQQSMSANMRPSNAVPLSMPMSNMPNGAPISVMKKLNNQHITMPQMRISGNGGMRPPSVAVSQNMSPPQSNHTSPPQVAPPAPPPKSEAAEAVGIVGPAEMHPSSPAANGAASDSHVAHSGRGSSPMRPPSAQNHNQHHPVTVPSNGYHVQPMNGYPPMSNGANFGHPTSQPQTAAAARPSVHMQQIQNALQSGQLREGDLQHLKQILNADNGMRNLQAAQYAAQTNTNSFNLQQLQQNANLNLKLPPSRQMQWAAVTSTSPMQRPMSVDNANPAMSGSMSPSPRLAHAVPARTPSRMGPGAQMGHHGMSISPHMQHSPTPVPMNVNMNLGHGHSSPPRPMPSPSLMHQVVGKSGY